MKKFGIVLFIVLLTALLTIAVSAKTVSFTPLTESETDYVLKVTAGAGKDNGNWFLDGENYIIYKFPVSARDIYAKFTATIGAQYEIAASSDNANYTVIDAAVKPDGAEPNWGADRVSRTYDLASFLTGENGFIYVRIADVEKANGWGPYIVSANKIVFSTSVPTGQSYSFKPFTDDEKLYTYEITAGSGNDAGNHFLDGTNYIVYRFPVSSKDTYALFSAKIGAQYMISASSDGVKYTTLDSAVKPEGAEPSWGADRKMRYVDVSDFITAYDGYVYIKIEDIDKGNGWGPYIVTADGVSFTTTLPNLPLKSLYHNEAGAYTGAGPVPVQATFDNTDLSAYFIDGMAVGVRVYVTGSSKFVDNGQFELTSSGASDQQEFHWGSTLGYGIHDGWNILVYPISAGQNESGALYEAINFIRLYQFSDAEYTFNVTDIFIGPQSKIEAQTASPLLYIRKGNTEVFAVTDLAVIQKNLETTLNLTGYLGKGMAVGIRVYVEGASKLADKEGQFELTSSGTCDVEEATFPPLVTFGLKDGWNLVVMPVDSIDISAVNTAVVNFYRLYHFGAGDFTIQISDIVIGPIYAVNGLLAQP